MIFYFPVIPIPSRILRIEWHKKLIRRLSYASLFLDVCIAIISLLSIWKIGNPNSLLLPINYTLTIIVVLSCVSAFLIILLRFSVHTVKVLNKRMRRRWNHRSKKYSWI